MQKILLCNGLYIKRSFKKISFIFLLITLPIFCCFLNSVVKNESTSVKVGIYSESKSEMADKLIYNLMSKYESVSFTQCSSVSQLKDKVISGDFECGYVIPDDFAEKIACNDLNNIIELYTSPGTFLASLSNEYIFSEIFKEYAVNELTEYIAAQDIFTISDVSRLNQELRTMYEDYLNSSEIFSFRYINGENEIIDNTDLLSSYFLLSIKGIIALVIMFVAFIGTFYLYKDKKSGIFRAFNSATGLLCKMSEIFSLTLIACISGLASIVLCGQSEGIVIETARFLLYAVICTIYCFIVQKILPNMYAFAALIPVFVLGSILLCPIFFDITEMIPVGKYAAWLFLPRYFFLF